jgi:hypothetical protein
MRRHRIILTDRLLNALAVTALLVGMVQLPRTAAVLLATTACLLALAWFWQFWHVRPLQRIRHGLCPTCGYDINFTPHRCPYCDVLVRSSGRVAPPCVKTCDFCSKPSEMTGPMVEGPSVHICSACLRQPTTPPPASTGRQTCSFCGKSIPPPGTALHGRSQAHMCPACIDLGLKIVADHQLAPPAAST